VKKNLKSEVWDGAISIPGDGEAEVSRIIFVRVWR